jgi:hypothetical protein
MVMTYLRCPDCRLTARASAYFVHGDRCPRCLTVMEPADRFRDAATPAAATAAISAGDSAPGLRASPRAG